MTSPRGSSSFLNHEIDNFSLANVQAGLTLKHFAHLDAVELLVALGAGTPDGRAAGGIQQAKLDANGIGHFTHDAAECVHFPDKMALGNAADGRIAAHLGYQV